MKRHLILSALLASTATAQERVPGDDWLRYDDPADAGWSNERLAEAEELWESFDSSAWMVVENGVVVVAWGDVSRRYMCHSVRKSFLSGLYGLHVDGGTIDTEQTLADLEIDDEPKLTVVEKQARIEDLLRSRSGVYKLAAYEPPQNPKPPRGTYEPGTYWCYNNFDFNTLGTIFQQETGRSIFEEFDARFAGPLDMQDYRARDGYLHYELDKSIHPAYPFRMSARDCARYGLLFLYEGTWGDERILSEEWVTRSTQPYSETGDPGRGYSYMWWTFADPANPESDGVWMYAAQGVGGQTIAVLPGEDLVIVNRTDTYVGNNVNLGRRLRLTQMIVAARTGERAGDPGLVPLETQDTPLARLDEAGVARLVGDYVTDVEPAKIRAKDGVPLLVLPTAGTYGLWPVGDDVFLIEDIEQYLFVETPAKGGQGTIVSEVGLMDACRELLGEGDVDGALEIAERTLELFPMSPMSHVLLAQIFRETGDPAVARELVEAALELDAEHQPARDLGRHLGR